MITFIIGLVILAVGGALYGRFAERAFGPTDATTPAYSMRDDVDFVPMKKHKNALIELLNIAGTGPILGPIQGILFGPIAFITIPVGCVIAGAFHDYMVGMISVRNKGEQVPGLVRRFLGKHIYLLYNVIVCLLLLLFSVVFIYTPGDLFVSQILRQEAVVTNPSLLVVYGVIFLYYLIATLFPIDKIIGRVYPVFGLILMLSAVGVFFGLFFNGYPLTELWNASKDGYPFQEHFIPIFFVTVSCGICSGFHATQATLVSRTTVSEKDGRTVFYNMMLAEGFIAMTWAAAAMGAIGKGIIDVQGLKASPTSVVGIVAKDMLGPVGGMIAIIGVIVLPVTSGDTSLRSLRLMIGEALHLEQSKKKNALFTAAAIFTAAAAVLIWSKADPAGFGTLWRYANWLNESTVVFVFAMIAVFMAQNKMPYQMALVPGTFYIFVVFCYIINARIGLGLPLHTSMAVSGIIAVIYVFLLWRKGKSECEK